MVFYIIGNGFDLHYGLNTRYDHFKDYLIYNGYSDLIQKVDTLFYDIGKFLPNEIKKWSKFEDMLESFNNLDAEYIYDEAMRYAEPNDERADFWESPAWNVNYYNDYIQVLKQEFKIWIENIDTSIIQDKYFMPCNRDFILTFNYTTTIEDNFKSIGYEILHIHGTVGQNLILGHNNFQEPYLFNIIEDDGSDYRDITTQKAVNQIIAEASVEYYKDSISILDDYKNIFKQIPFYNKVVIMGLSCGDQDKLYICEILKYANYIEFFYHDKNDINNFERYASNYDIHVKYIKW